MHGEKKSKSRAAIALALCFAVMALTSALAVRNTLDKISNNGTAVTDNETSVTKQQEASAKTPVVDSKSKTGGNSGNGTTDTKPADYIAPVAGAVLLKYSMDSLVYSKTLDQYMTHPGVDICADKSSEVKAIADGTVSKVYTDDRYGITVCISHGDGLTSKYSNLSEHGLAETGDEVTQGQSIGCIGSTALFESLDESHLHFEMIKDENPVNPGEYIDKLKQ